MSILIDKQYWDYEYTSRYSKFPVYYNTVDNKYVYGLTSNLKINPQIKSFEYSVQPGDTLDALALKYYGRPDYYWVIADYNRIKDSLVQLYGKYKTLTIPNILSIEFI
jgi:hypothetical protein